jgi:hypothetical protein
MAVKMSMLVFWCVTPCGLLGRHQRFGKALVSTYISIRAEDENIVFLRIVGSYLSTSPHRVTTKKNIVSTLRLSINSPPLIKPEG